LREGAVRVGAYLHYRLAELAAEHPRLGEVRGEGLHQTVEVIADRHTRTPDSIFARRIASEMARRGVLVSGAAGPRTNLIRIRPAMPFALEHVDLLVNALQEALRTVGP
jgi:4-aminobutyrate aminotransferase-like enzyme